MKKPPTGTGKAPFSFEYSAGGIVRRDDKILMVKVENLEGQVVWTFPKGHIEKGEKAPEAALREVEEETGYRCGIVKPLERTQYWFKRDGRLVKKTVTWFLMKPERKTGLPDADEIRDTRWASSDEATALANYKSDQKILATLKENL